MILHNALIVNKMKHRHSQVSIESLRQKCCIFKTSEYQFLYLRDGSATNSLRNFIFLTTVFNLKVLLWPTLQLLEVTWVPKDINSPFPRLSTTEMHILLLTRDKFADEWLTAYIFEGPFANTLLLISFFTWYSPPTVNSFFFFISVHFMTHSMIFLILFFA